MPRGVTRGRCRWYPVGGRQVPIYLQRCPRRRKLHQPERLKTKKRVKAVLLLICGIEEKTYLGDNKEALRTTDNLDRPQCAYDGIKCGELDFRPTGTAQLFLVVEAPGVDTAVVRMRYRGIGFVLAVSKVQEHS